MRTVYRLDRALDEYREKFGGLPTELKDLLARDSKSLKGFPTPMAQSLRL